MCGLQAGRRGGDVGMLRMCTPNPHVRFGRFGGILAHPSLGRDDRPLGVCTYGAISLVPSCAMGLRVRFALGRRGLRRPPRAERFSGNQWLCPCIVNRGRACRASAKELARAPNRGLALAFLPCRQGGEQAPDQAYVQ